MAAMDDDDEKAGAQIMIAAMGYPCMQVAENAGIEGAVVLAKIQELCDEKGVSFGLLGSIVWYCYLFFSGRSSCRFLSCHVQQ